MPFHKITFNEAHRFATLHNQGCTFRCPVCSYKLRSGADGRPGRSHPEPERFLSVEDMKRALAPLAVNKVYFMGGEPTCALELPEMLAFARRTMNVRTALGHTNGSRLPLRDLDAANVGLKAWDPVVHRRYTGWDREIIFGNVERAFRAGIELRANAVLVPGLVDGDQVEAIARWLSDLSPDIPFHVMGYIPVPGQPYARPTAEQVAAVVESCRRHLRTVASSRLSPEEAVDLAKRDDRFAVRRVA